MSDGGISKEPMLEIYLFETTQLIEQLEEISIECEKNKVIDTESINEIFRIMHTIKSSSAMMMFNNISTLAHSLEDLFFFIRENKNIVIDTETLFDLVLLVIDFIKSEIEKIENGENADASSDELIVKISNHLEEMRFNNNLTKDSDTDKKEDKNIKYYISSYQDTDETTFQKYYGKIFFEEDCGMEDVRAYTVIHNLKDIAGQIYHIPEDIMEDSTSSEYIRKNGFLVCFETDVEEEKIKDLFNGIILLKEFEFKAIEEYPHDIKSLFKKKEINLEENDFSIEESNYTSQCPSAEIEIKQKNNICSEESTARNLKQQSIISVNILKLDMLLDLVGEIVISEAMVTRNPDLQGLQLDNFNKAARQLRKLTNELQDIVMSIRMVPVSMTFHKMNRIVRDMCKKLHKEVDLEIIGEDTEVDKNIIDHISDPLMHLVRNSLDHGIETREKRIASGKNEVGKITLEAKNAGSDVFIIVKDDGGGIDKSKIYEKAKRQGLVSKEENELTDKEIFSFILLPGFSTNEVVTEYSGRGVGMDVVKKNIDSIGGSISFDSVYGAGTTITIKIPLTLAIINGLEISVGKSKYTLPISAIKESFKPKADEIIEDSNGNEMIMIRGEAYPIYRLHKIFNTKTDVIKASDGIMIMVEGNTKSACIFADELIGEQQVVVKALPTYIKKAEGIAGCTILGDGSISLILDINEILNR